MRILEAFGEPISYGGQESFVMNVLDHMDRTGFTVDLLSPYYCDNSGIVTKIAEYGGATYTLGCDFRPGSLRNSAERPIRSFFRTHERYDVIHVHSGSNSMLAMFARLAAESGIPKIIVHSHCTGEKGLRHHLSKMVTSRSLSRYPTAYCACSREAGEWRFPADVCRRVIMQNTHENSDYEDHDPELSGSKRQPELLIINNGIDVGNFRYNENVRHAMRSRLGIKDNTVLIGCVGRLTYQKNQEFLLEVMRRIQDVNDTQPDTASFAPDAVSGAGDAYAQNMRNYRLLLVGEGEDRFALEKKAAALGLTDDVIFTGAVSNVDDYLQAIDVVALPSRYEGLAISVIEAQAAGLEIIASDRIPASAAVTGGVTFMPIDNVRRWASAVMQIHERHPEQADEVAANGYSVTDTARVVRDLYCFPASRCRCSM